VTQEHGGTITVDSRVAISPNLPFGCRALTGRQSRRQHHECQYPVVDDEPDVADLFRQRFRREARQGTYVMHFTASGAEALDRLSGEIQPTLVAVLSDINMPGMDGLQLLGAIKQRRPDLPVMMVTAYGDDERRRRARELGASEFITKPVDFDQLKEQLRRLPTAAD
jgi:CheY-like chemotaxis protein